MSKNGQSAGRRKTEWVPRPLTLSNGDVGIITEPLGSIVPAGKCRWRWTEGPRKGERCRRLAVWGIGLCDHHGGRDPERHEQLRKELELFESQQMVTLQSMLARLQAIMDANASLFYDEDTGELLQPAEWPPEAWQIYKSAKVLNYNADPTDGEQQRVMELQVSDRRWAFELAAKIAGLIVERAQLDARVQHEHKMSQPLVDALLEGQERVARGALPAAGRGGVIDAQVVRGEKVPVKR